MTMEGTAMLKLWQFPDMNSAIHVAVAAHGEHVGLKLNSLQLGKGCTYPTASSVLSGESAKQHT